MAIYRNPLLLRLSAALAVFAAALIAFTLLNRSSSSPSSASSDAGNPATLVNAPTDVRIKNFQLLVRTHPKDSRGYGFLGDAYLQKVRETGDASYYTRAGAVYATALKLNPRDPAAVTGMGALALARHDFRGGLRYGLEARRLAPLVVKPYGVVVDAEVELGRYKEAAAHAPADGRSTAEPRLVRARVLLRRAARRPRGRRPGDAAGGVRRRRRGRERGLRADAAREPLLPVGKLRPGARGVPQALARFPGYVPASAGLAGVEAADYDFGSAIARYRDAVNRLPLPQYVVSLGETELAAGKSADARRDFGLVGAEEKLLQANGVNTDVDLALFEASHGSPARAVLLARRAWAEAPSVRSADSLGWALTSAGHPAMGLRWARRALALGSKDPMFLYHAGISAKGAGHSAEARGYLTRSLALNPRFSPLYAPRAERALKQLGR